MSKNTENNGSGTFIKVLTGIIVILLILGVVGAMVYLINRPQGLYLEYNGAAYGDSLSGSASGGITVTESTAVFKVCKSGGWGVYSVEDCTVKVVPNADERRDFAFTVAGNEQTHLFSDEGDLTAAFVEYYDGNGLDVASDGTFTLTFDEASVGELLCRKYGKTVSCEGDHLITDYPYLALSVTSPDGEQTLVVPLFLHISVEGIHFDKEGIVL